jgi:hypothetical protein
MNNKKKTLKHFRIKQNRNKTIKKRFQMGGSNKLLKQKDYYTILHAAINSIKERYCFNIQNKTKIPIIGINKHIINILKTNITIEQEEEDNSAIQKLRNIFRMNNETKKDIMDTIQTVLDNDKILNLFKEQELTFVYSLFNTDERIQTFLKKRNYLYLNHLKKHDKIIEFLYFYYKNVLMSKLTVFTNENYEFIVDCCNKIEKKLSSIMDIVHQYQMILQEPQNDRRKRTLIHVFDVNDVHFPGYIRVINNNSLTIEEFLNRINTNCLTKDIIDNRYIKPLLSEEEEILLFNNYIETNVGFELKMVLINDNHFVFEWNNEIQDNFLFLSDYVTEIIDYLKSERIEGMK